MCTPDAHQAQVARTPGVYQIGTECVVVLRQRVH